LRPTLCPWLRHNLLAFFLKRLELPRHKLRRSDLTLLSQLLSLFRQVINLHADLAQATRFLGREDFWLVALPLLCFATLLVTLYATIAIRYQLLQKVHEIPLVTPFILFLRRELVVLSVRAGILDLVVWAQVTFSVGEQLVGVEAHKGILTDVVIPEVALKLLLVLK